MPLELDNILGALYLSPEDFRKRASAFGARVALPEDEDELKAHLAGASRAIDAFCGRPFSPEAVTETHRLDAETRRVSVNRPPVLELTGFTILSGPDRSFAVETSQVFVNRQENYLEVVSWGALIGLAAGAGSLGIIEPQAEVTYKSYQDVPQAVAAACGYAAAKFMNQAYASGQLPDGIQRVRLGNSFEITRGAVGFGAGEIELPAIAQSLLAQYRRIAVG